MKLVFICGSLEPGRDGVGDYVRRLAIELIRQGHEASVIALNDQYVLQEFFDEQLVDLGNLFILRLPASWSSKHQFSRTRQFIEEFQPTWISLQFVPYSFHDKGLPIFLGWHLRKLTQGQQVHLMMHEIWIGTEFSSSLKSRLIARLQKAVVHTTIKSLHPSIIHTHLPTYRAQLQHIGSSAFPLPLFSNIPVVKQLPITADADANVFRVGIFSQADGNAFLAGFLDSLAQHLVQRGQCCQVLLMGGRASEMQALAASLNNIAGLGGQVCYAGFLEPTQLSAAIQTCHLGLTSVPRHGLGKSGSVAAFLAHGIPVAAPVVHNTHKATDIGFFSESLRACILLQPTTVGLRAAQASSALAQHTIQVSTIAQQLLQDLTQAQVNYFRA